MYVESCTFSCNNGKGGQQVSCGILNTFRNVDVAVEFSEPVSLPSLLANNSFQVFDSVTAAVPPGTRLVSPSNPNRAIFRPKLTFDTVGNPIFGFLEDTSYQIKIPGTKQNDPGPYVESAGGQPNTSRMLCTITTSEGVIDPVAGPPQVSIFVQVEGNPVPVNLDLVANVTDVLTNSPITFVFNDLMNIGTVISPGSGQAPFITVVMDADGNLGTAGDQIPIGGNYSFNINQTTLQTTLVFVPAGGFPSAGSGPTPRRVVVTVPPQVKDLVGNSVANVGPRTFVPQVVPFAPLMLPTGGEQFVDTVLMDARRTSADWGETTPGRLLPGVGGGSGRYGDLSLAAGAKTLYTTSQPAIAKLVFAKNLKGADQAAVSFDNGLNVAFRKVLTDPNTEIQIDDFVGDTLAEAVRYLESNPTGDPGIAQLDFSLEVTQPLDYGVNTLVIRHANPGSAPNGTFKILCYSASQTIALIGTNVNTQVGPPVDPGDNWVDPNRVPYIRGYMTGGVDAGLTDLVGAFNPNDFITNLPFGAPIPPPVLSSGVLEFARIVLGPGATLNVVGDIVPRLFARGSFEMADTALVDLDGGGVGQHPSDCPLGQWGGVSGPGGGRGGQGGDRQDNTNHASLIPPAMANCTTQVCGNLTNCSPPLLDAANKVSDTGVTNAGAVTNGRLGQGVGGAAGFGGNVGLGSGQGGVQWPAALPTASTGAMAGLDAAGATCLSQQVGGSGSGGAFATDGAVGISVSNVPLGVLGTPNAPANTVGGSSASLNLEPAGAPGPKRKLTPSLGYLRGGSGGGGGGSHPYDTHTTVSSGSCFGAASAITEYHTHSGAGGGGGGGAIQLVAGRYAQMNGRIDVSGGNGGGAIGASVVPCAGRVAMPGGGGSGGAVLLQSKTVVFPPLPNRIDVGGGAGGSGQTLSGNTSFGGDGGVGLVRIEDNSALDPVVAAASVFPTDPLDPQSSRWLSVGAWTPGTSGPEAYSGGESCWIKAVGSFFSLTFDADLPGTPGWDMDVWINGQKYSYRNATPPAPYPPPPFGGNTPEQHWGNLFDDGTLVPPQTGSPIIVRFQGARAVGNLPDPCNVDLNDTQVVVSGSVTPWVSHPNELNLQNPPPDMIRYQILFDRSHPDFAQIQGITNVRIMATPD